MSSHRVDDRQINERERWRSAGRVGGCFGKLQTAQFNLTIYTVCMHSSQKTDYTVTAKERKRKRLNTEDHQV